MSEELKDELADVAAHLEHIQHEYVEELNQANPLTIVLLSYAIETVDEVKSVI